VALMAGTGALGGVLWFNTAGKPQGGVPPAPAMLVFGCTGWRGR
jgi:hypothetical protein